LDVDFHSILNFASGDEKPEEEYGGEKCLARLQALNEKWDQEGILTVIICLFEGRAHALA
jgi:hypothetical protein